MARTKLLSLSLLGAVALAFVEARSHPVTVLDPLPAEAAEWQAPSVLMAAPAHTELAAAQSIYLPFVNRNAFQGYVSPFGIVMYGDVDDNAGLAKMRAAGAGWVTTIMSWRDIEPNEPVSGTHTYDWSIYDTKFSNARAAGMRVFVLFLNNPSWAAPTPWGVVPESRLPDLASVAAAMAERYDGDGLDDAPGSPVVNDWSFYGEPDAYYLWGQNGADFARMMATVSPAIRAANPNARVLIGGIGYDWFTDDEYHNPPGPFVRGFITDTLGTLNASYGGARQHIDAFDFHYYLVTPERWPTIREKGLEIRQIMANHGVADVPLIVSEMGYWSDWLDSNQTRQAQYLVHFFVRGIAVGIEHLSWWTVFDEGRPEWTDGLFVGRDLNQPKLSYFAYQTLTQELGYTRYVGSLNAAGVEGYTFAMADGRQKSVVWGASPVPSAIAFPHACLQRVEMLGSSAPATDGGIGDLDGAVNGQVRLQVFPDQPIYVVACN